MFTGAAVEERSRLELGRGAQIRDRSARGRPYSAPYNAWISRAARGPLVPTECILLQLNEKAMCASGSAKPMEPPRP